MLRNFNLTEYEKSDIRYLVDRELRARKWWNKYLETTYPSNKDKEKVLYATWYALSEYCGYHKPREIIAVSDDTLKKLKLYTKLETVVMKDVPEIDGVDMNYIVRLLFPGYFKENEQDFAKRLVQNCYNAVLDGSRSFSKHYFDRRLHHQVAVSRAHACLEYAINEQYSSIKDAYYDFASNGVISKLRSMNLESAWKQCGYILPIDYLHDTVVNTPEHTDDDELLYQELRFCQIATQFQLEEGETT